jgi:hypothetical protein
VIAKRVYVDGREELVRGATFGGLPMQTLKDIAIGSGGTTYSWADTVEGLAGSVVTPPVLFRTLAVRASTEESVPMVLPRP